MLKAVGNFLWSLLSRCISAVGGGDDASSTKAPAGPSSSRRPTIHPPVNAVGEVHGSGNAIVWAGNGYNSDSRMAPDVDLDLVYISRTAPQHCPGGTNPLHMRVVVAGRQIPQMAGK